MPELPEVEVVRAGLERLASPFRVETAQVCHPRATRHSSSPAEFVRELTGRTIEGWAVRGKYIWGILDDGRALIVHLGMSGQVLVDTHAVLPRRHTRILLRQGDATLTFVDQRTFGYFRLDTLEGDAANVPAGRGQADGRLPQVLRHVARDVLDPNLDIAAAARAAKLSARPIKAVLLDQTVASGIGNIYADEALWAAGVHPAKPARRIAAWRIEELYRQAGMVMRRALAEGGTSFDTLYVNTAGEPGYFARSLDAYGRAGESCRRCTGIMEKTTVAGRGTTFCPRCQRK
ncbi:MAG: bifunctional DNA-formamidopyrimidine glycosylase/DNA-(apurinic or apyrimidinic site) lyase [Actinomycetaceae bacterium]|nr:bifunctional DNA-formamidopyrimidine glycosylase/DNA-(apurinic or apyrimidinic site) lyase [Actinomycetaceae bacterium]